MFSGKLIARKAPLQLFEAVLQLPAALRARVVLLFLGDGDLRAQIEARLPAMKSAPS
jgi:hypothetical protein